jgi:formimidoylglutamate deiminase
MLELAGQQTSERVRTGYEQVYLEMRGAGYTVVGEFHYLGFEQALAAAEAAQAAEITFVLLYVAYARGGLDRFRQPSPAEYLNQVENLRERGLDVGLAPHSVRACPPQWLAQIGRYAYEHDLPLHVHADEQPREIEECIEEHGIRPIELLAKHGCLGPRTTIVHATHADDAELDLVAETGSRICVCPTTEANLGDGYFPVERVLERGIGICIGSDSNARIDPLEELRELEGIARRSELRRNVIPLDNLLRIGADEGAASLALQTWPDAEVDLDHPSLAGLDEPDARAALVFGCAADVFV